MTGLRVGMIAAGLLLVAAGAAEAACTGSNGRGWGQGKGAGAFTMTQADKTCRISHPGIINETTGTRVPATQSTVTRPPSNGTLDVSAAGVVYRPKPGFTGTDRFCTRNTAKGVPGVTLSGCVSVAVK